MDNKQYIIERNRLIKQAAEMASVTISPKKKIAWGREFMRCMIILATDKRLCLPANLYLFDMEEVKGCAK
jgi:hypothetical protein